MDGKNLLNRLDEAFAGVDSKQIRAFDRLMKESATINNLGERVGDSLGEKPIYYLRIISYLATKGSGTYTTDGITEAVSIPDPKQGKMFSSFQVSEVLGYCRKKNIFEVKFGTPKSPAEVNRTPIEIDISPLSYRWGFPREEAANA